MKDIYVEFRGSNDIKGESTDAFGAPKFAIEVASFKHIISQPKSSTSSTAGGHTAERAEHGEIILTKEIDAASTKLWQACSAGTIHKDVIIYFFRAFGGQNTTATGITNSRIQYLTVELKNVLVSTVQTAIVPDSELPTEVFGLKYSAIQWTYKKAPIDGSPASATAIGMWNLKQNNVTFAG